MIKWFKAIRNKDKHTFIQFAIVEYYPSITEDLLKKALNFAKAEVNISDEEIDTIMKTKKVLLFCKGNPWTKKGNKSFDVTMGSWDGAEVADLVGLFLLSQLTNLNLNVGLYRDDGLAACCQTRRQVEIIKKKMCKMFSKNSLKITVKANKRDVNFLDINLNRNGTL